MTSRMGFNVLDRISKSNLPDPLRRLPRPRRSRKPLRVCPRCGFSLPELLVVTGILVALIALLLPCIGKVREKAVEVVCTGRLRQLVNASCQYASLNHGWFPAAAGTGQAAAVPNMLPARLLNDLRPYVGYPAITRDATTGNLPPSVQCPQVERLDGQRGPFEMKAPGLVVVTYYTGYVYLGGLGRDTGAVKRGAARPKPSFPAWTPRAKLVPGDALGRQVAQVVGPPLPTTATVLRPGRAAAKAGDPGTLWADDVSLGTSSNGVYWRFAHPRHGAAGGPETLSYANPRGCLGQHRAYAEGRVEWVPAEQLGLGGGEAQAEGMTTKAASPLDAAASYKAGSGYWWF